VAGLAVQAVLTVERKVVKVQEPAGKGKVEFVGLEFVGVEELGGC
jgi:hypothetical protein